MIAVIATGFTVVLFLVLASGCGAFYCLHSGVDSGACYWMHTVVHSVSHACYWIHTVEVLAMLATGSTL